ncbi:hydroxymethylglutaryl-CoA lyase [Flavobacteriales bacterium]|nr:hydroxymethylglutaryl-CoA lyase [Flavobacteriales bacterium]
MKIIECPRDAMQGIERFIPTAQKVSYLNALLKVGFDTLDFGSFVSPTSMPQMRDTADVLSQLNQSHTKLLAIVANQRGAEDACQFERIDFLGYPFSVSETFQKRNTNKSIDESLILVDKIQNSCVKSNKSLVVYLSMAFGNPYDELWHEDIVSKWGEKLSVMGIETIALSDTIGVSNPDNISRLFTQLITEHSNVEWGAHLHTSLESWREKVESAYNSGCRRFDSAVKGLGGCPMAKDELVGNMPTEKLISFCNEKKIDTSIDSLAFESAYNKAVDTF